MEAIFNLNSLCPNCGEFVDELDDVTGFCNSCSNNGVGSLDEKDPTPTAKAKKIELWLHENADRIESFMLAENVNARFAIRELMQEDKPRCLICGNDMPHTTSGRHMFCTKQPECRKARRYYRYLVYEKNESKEKALEQTLERYAQ